MASEYTLKLKATLDTAEVQQELQKLRQQASIGGGGTSAAGNQPMDIGTKTLNTTLSKLNTAISLLNKSIERLMSGVPGKQQQPVVSGSHTTSMLPGAYSGLGTAGQMFKQNVLKDFFKTNLDMSNRLFLKLVNKEIRDSSRIGRMLQEQFPDHTAADANLFRRTRAKDFLAQGNPARQNVRMMRSFGGMIGGQLFGELGDTLTSNGYTRWGGAVSGVGKGLTAGSSTAMMIQSAMPNASTGLLAGAGIAAGIGTAVVAISEAMVKYAESISAAQDEATRIFNSARASLKAEMKTSKFMQFEDSLVGKSSAELKPQLDAAQAEFDKKKSEYYKYSSDEYVNAEKTKIYDKFLDGVNVTDAGSSERVAVEATLARELKALSDKVASYRKAMEESEKKLKTLDAAYDKAKAAEDSKTAKEKAEADRISRERDMLLKKNSDSIEGYKSDSAMYAVQSFANSVLGDKTLGPAAQFTALSERLDSLRKQRHDARSEAMGISRDIEANGSSMTNDEIKAKQEQQRKLDNAARDASAQIGVIESALQQINTQQTAPDISHVTSLGQYGFNMGEKDDTVERMDKYYTKSINLQQQIKDKLDEGIKAEASYSN